MINASISRDTLHQKPNSTLTAFDIVWVTVFRRAFNTSDALPPPNFRGRALDPFLIIRAAPAPHVETLKNQTRLIKLKDH